MTVDRRLLPATFGPWFARFPSLTEVQLQAIPPIMEGRDVLICSATASGKTEAYAAPAAELVRKQGGGSVAVLIVAPTRALSNDLHRRLEGPMGLVGVSLGRYTGEHKERVAGQLPSVLIATPEALDSLLARRSQLLRATRLVVIDEVHILDNTPRGDQLRILLQRLESCCDSRPQRVAASATVDQPAQLGARYLREPELIVVPGLRKIQGKPFDGKAPAQVGAHLEELAGHGFKKVLVFCRSRNQVETLATKLRDATGFGSEIYAHHGSLAKNLRERTERLFQRAPAAVCFATLTLEMGIDIGTVDYVLLAALPADISSLLQRIGRGGRRGESTRCGFICEDAGEDFLFRTMFRLGKAGRLCPRPYGFRPSVIVQQALVMACAETYIQLADVKAILPPAIRAELGADACVHLLRSMVEEGLLESTASDRYVPSEEIEARYQRGSLHSNIDDSASMEVVDRMTGDVVGNIQMADASKIEIGGRNRAVVRQIDDRILTDASAGATPARFRPAASPSVSLALARAVVESLGAQAGTIGVVSLAGSVLLLHGLGTLGSLLFLELLKRSTGRGQIEECSPYVMKIRAELPALPELHEDLLLQFIETHIRSLTKLVSVGPWRRAVPAAMQLESVRRMSGLTEVATFLRSAQLQRIEELEPTALAALATPSLSGGTK